MKRFLIRVWLGLSGMLVIPTIALAAVWGPYTLESRLDDAAAVVLGIVLPGEEGAATFRTLPCERPPLPPDSPIAYASPDCPVTFYRLQVLEDLRGTIPSGAHISIVNTGEGVFVDPKDNKRHAFKTSASPDFAVGEKVLVILGKPQIISPKNLSALEKEMGNLYVVVVGETGKWMVEPDDALHRGPYQSGGRRIPVPIPPEVAFGPNPPQQQPTVSRIEDSPELKERKAERERRSKFPSIEASLATGQPIWNPTEMTLDQMRQAVIRHKMESPEQRKHRKQLEVQELKQRGWRP